MYYTKCRKSAYFARKLLRLVSGRFSASSGNINMHKRHHGNEYLYVILWNIRFQHFASRKGGKTDSAYLFMEHGASPVETQNLASPVGSIATHAGNKALTKLDLPTCETQDFASLLLVACVMILSFLLCIAMAQALYVCKNLRLPSNTWQYPHRHFIIPSFCLIFV